MKGTRCNYLRTHRKRYGLTQREVGFLVGLDSGQIISRYEVYSSVPTFRTVLACQIIFDELPHKLFPGMHQEIEASIATRIMQLIEVLGEHEPSPGVLQKQDALRNMLRRIKPGESDV